MLTQRGHDRLAIDPEGFFLVVVLQVTANWSTLISFNCLSLAM